MKKRIFYMLLLSVLILAGCEEDFLTQLPLDKLSDQNYWTTEDNVRTFAWGFYISNFPGYGSGYGYGSEGGGKFFSRQKLNDDFGPQSLAFYTSTVPTSGGGWSFGYVRKANIFINRVKTVPMSEEKIKHWTGIGRFFRGLEYADLVNRFGDVPYFGQELEEDSPELYKPRDPRTLVMDSVLADFQYAAENVLETDALTGPKNLTVNKYVVLAFMSRIFLFEGTWQKYNDVNSAKANEYLQAAKWAANEVISNGGYSISNDYRGLCSSVDLATNPEMILYRQYESGILTHAVMGYNSINAVQEGPSKNLIESYLCKDGLPITLSLNYMGDKTIQDVMANRDPRLSKTFVTELRLPGIAANYSSTGYATHKFLNEALKEAKEAFLDLNITDAPIIRYGEILLNYAEAAAELGQLTQNDLDISINKLRDRAGVMMPYLQVVGGNPAVEGVVYEDPQRDPSVPPLIWEIRRERRIELVFEGFRLDDLRRWKKLEYTDTQQNVDINRGAWIKKSDYPSTSATIEGGVEGYIIPSPITQRIFDNPRIYLYPLPLDQITLYKDHGVDLSQNPGWE